MMQPTHLVLRHYSLSLSVNHPLTPEPSVKCLHSLLIDDDFFNKLSQGNAFSWKSDISNSDRSLMLYATRHKPTGGLSLLGPSHEKSVSTQSSGLNIIWLECIFWAFQHSPFENYNIPRQKICVWTCSTERQINPETHSPYQTLVSCGNQWKVRQLATGHAKSPSALHVCYSSEIWVLKFNLKATHFQGVWKHSAKHTAQTSLM